MAKPIYTWSFHRINKKLICREFVAIETKVILYTYSYRQRKIVIFFIDSASDNPERMEVFKQLVH